MRLGVLQIGVAAGQLVVVDTQHEDPAGHPVKYHATLPRHKEPRDQENRGERRAGADAEPDADRDAVRSDVGSLDAGYVRAVVEFVEQAVVVARAQGCTQILAFAGSAIQAVGDCEQAVATITSQTGVQLQVLQGEDEARLTFLAARRWFGWSAGQMLVLEVGDGTVRVGYGNGERPDVVVAALIGAGRLTRELMDGDPPTQAGVQAVAQAVKEGMATGLGPVFDRARRQQPAVQVVGAGALLGSLAGFAAAPASVSAGAIGGGATGGGAIGGGDRAVALGRVELSAWVSELAGLTAAERSALPGVAQRHGAPLLAGAIIAEAALHALNISTLVLSPWSVREGVILQQTAGAGWTPDREQCTEAGSGG
ncbi:MAG: hypothetical protein ACRC35_10505 [Angustibacter sp.]